VTASVLGQPALARNPHALALLAIAAFVASVLSSLYVLVPTRRLVFALAGSEIYERLYEFRSNIGEVHRQLAYQLDRTWVANAREIRWLLWWFRAAAGALVAEILFLLIAAGGILG
jgi:hypothetical protein